MKRGSWIGAGAAVVVVAAGLGWYVAGEPVPWSGETKPDAPSPLAIHATTVREVEIEDQTQYTASVVSPQIATLHPRVSGTIMQRPFKPGGQVTKGDLLFLVDPRPFEAALAQDMAQREQAEASLVFAREEVERYKPLENRGFASQEKLQEQQRDRDTAAGQVNAAQARIMRDKLDIEYSRVVAPFTGQAGITNVNAGDLAVADQTDLVSLAQLDPIDVQVALSAADVRRVRSAMEQGRTVDVALLGPTGQEDGRVARIVEFDNQYNPRTDRMLVRARLANPDLSLAPGDFLHVIVRFGKVKQLLVPTEALSYRLNQAIVYVVKDGTVQSRVVDGSRQHGQDTVITDGLQPGDRIATDHISRLHAGRSVTVATDEQAEAD